MIKIPCKDLREFMSLQQFELEDGTRLITKTSNWRNNGNYGHVDIELELYTVLPARVAGTPAPATAVGTQVKVPADPALPEKLW